MQRFVVVGALVSWATVAAAQVQTGQLRGVVQDEEGAPIAGAVVAFQGTDVIASTDDRGAFVVDLPVGDHQVSVFAEGFDSVESSAVVTATASTPVLYRLGPATAGSEVITVVTRAPEKTVNVPATAAVVKPREIMASVSYQAALANVMGVDVYTTGISTNQVSTRGFYKQLNLRMVSMVDGHIAQFPGAGLNMGDWAPASPLDMRFVEVVSGPSSAQYGANAVAGVIDVRTKSPWDESGGAFMVRAGSQDLVETAGRVAGTIGDDFGWKLNGQYLRADDWVPDRDMATHYYGTPIFEGDFVDNYRVTTLKLDASAYYRLGDWQAKASSGFARADGMQLINTGRYQARGSNVLLSVAQLKGPDWYFSVAHTRTSAGDSYFVDQAIRAAAARGGVPPDEATREAIREATALHDESQLWNAEIQYQRDISRVGLTTGAEARLYLPSSEGTYLADSAGVDLDTAEAGAFVQADTRFVDDRLRFIGAARLDVHDNYGAQLSPKLVASFDIAPQHVARIGASRAYKSPSIVETYLLTAGGAFRGNLDGFEIRDADGNVVREIGALDPEIGTALEAGYKGVFASRVFGEVVGHYTFYENFISPLTPVASPMGTPPTFGFTPDGEMIGNGTLFTYVNFGEAQVAGGDVRASYEGDHLLASASASYVRVISRDGGDLPEREITLNIPEVKTVATLGVKDIGVDGWYVKADARYRSAFAFESGYWSSSALMLPGGELPSRFVVDAAAGYQIPWGDMGVSVVAKNLFDNDELEILGAPAPRRLVFVQLEVRASGLRF